MPDGIIKGTPEGLTVVPIRVDAATHVLTGIDYAHHEIHGGSGYDITEVVDLAQDACRDIVIATPIGAKLAHVVFDFFAEAETEWWLWEDIAIVLAGTAITPRNHRRDYADDSMLTCTYIDNTSLANANADNAIADATLLAHGFVGAGKKIGGSASSREEWILAPGPGMVYMLRFDATAAGYVSYHIDWYEHTDR